MTGPFRNVPGKTPEDLQAMHRTLTHSTDPQAYGSPSIPSPTIQSLHVYTSRTWGWNILTKHTIRKENNRHVSVTPLCLIVVFFKIVVLLPPHPNCLNELYILNFYAKSSYCLPAALISIF